jgi:hypothetical protein
MSELDEIVDISQHRRLVRRTKKMVIIEEEYLTDETHHRISEENNQDTIGQQEVIFYTRPTFSKIKPLDKKEIDDFTERKELAQTLGLDSLPSKRIQSVDDIDGLFDEITDEPVIDTVRLVKDLRRRC